MRPNAAETNKNICFTKGEGALDHSTVTRWFKKFRSSYKNLEDQTRSSRPKTLDSEAVLQAIEVNLASSIRRLSGELGISQSNVVRHIFMISGKASEAAELYCTFQKILQNFWFTKVVHFIHFIF